MKKMNGAARQTFVMTVFLAGTLIAGAMLYFRLLRGSSRVEAYLDGGGNMLLYPEAVILMAIVLLGIGAIGFAFWRKARLDRLMEALNDDYRWAYESLLEYVRLSGLNRGERSEIMDEVLTLFLEAQKNGRTVSEVIGKEQKAFADEMIAAYGIRNFWVYDLMSGVQFFVFYMLAGTFLYSAKYGQGIFNVELPYTLILFFVISAFVAIPLVYRHKRKLAEQGDEKRAVRTIGVLLLMVAVFGGFIVSIEIFEGLADSSPGISAFLRGKAAVVASAWHLAVLLFSLAMATRLKKRLRRFEK